MRMPWRRSQPLELELVRVELAEGQRVDQFYWLKELPCGKYAMLLRAFDKTPIHAMAVEKDSGSGSVFVVRPKR